MRDPKHLKYILDAEGRPVPCDDAETWGVWMGRAQLTRETVVAQDQDEGAGGESILVSTVFLGLDHRFIGDGPPILWETMVFRGPLDGEQHRYSSHEAALAGHQAICQRVRAALDSPPPRDPVEHQ